MRLEEPLMGGVLPVLMLVHTVRAGETKNRAHHIREGLGARIGDEDIRLRNYAMIINRRLEINFEHGRNPQGPNETVGRISSCQVPKSNQCFLLVMIRQIRST
jgi:hypothetical protein